MFFRLITFCLIIVATLWVPVKAFSAKKKKKNNIHVNVTRTDYQDIKLSSTAEEIEEPEFDATIDIEFGVRIFSVFNFILGAGQSEDGLRSGFGLGGRVDLPGVFFLGARSTDMKRSVKRYPVNTSVFILSCKTVTKNQFENSETTAVSVRYGLSADIFLFNPTTYLTISTGIHSASGNAFSASSIGLGFQF